MNRKFLYVLLVAVAVLFFAAFNLFAVSGQDDFSTDVKKEGNKVLAMTKEEARKFSEDALKKLEAERIAIANEDEEARRARLAKEAFREQVLREAEAEARANAGNLNREIADRTDIAFEKIDAEAETVLNNAEQVVSEAEKVADANIEKLSKEAFREQVLREAEAEIDNQLKEAEENIKTEKVSIEPVVDDVTKSVGAIAVGPEEVLPAETLPKATKVEKAVNVPEQVESEKTVVETSVEDKAKEDVKAKAKAEREAAKKAREAEDKERAANLILFGKRRQSATLYFSPYGYRSIDANCPKLCLINSFYGMGGKLKYRHLLGSGNGLYVSADAMGETYFLNHIDESNYTDVTFMPKIGYNVELGKYVALYAETGFGADLTCYDTYARLQWLLGLELGVGFRADDNWTVELSGEGTWSWHGANGRYYSPASAWMINMFIGATYKF